MGTVSLSTLAVTALVGFSRKTEVPVFHDGNSVILGERPPKSLLLLPDEEILGQHYGILLRENLSSGWMVSNNFHGNTVPEGIDRLVLSGDFPDFPENFNFKGEIVILNSLRMLKKSGQSPPGHVILGSFRKDTVAKSIRYACAEEGFGWNLELMRGKKLYLGNWMKALELTKDQKHK